MKYTTFRFTILPNVEPARDLLAALCGELGFESFEETEEGINGYVPADLVDEAAVGALLPDFPMPGVRISYTKEAAEERNWNAVWECNGFETINIDGRCCIHDARKDDGCIDDGKVLHVAIEPCQAFGTGTHETTRMIVSELLDMDLSGKRVLDCGCGTGILSIIASRLGASDIVCYDIDEWSVNNTKHNAGLNKVGNIEVFEGDARVLSHVNGLFDVVLANINRNILLADMPHFKDVMAPGGLLLLSGFFVEDAPLLVEEAHRLGLVVSKQREDNGWCMLQLKL